MKKILFVIESLSGGGAEKVLTTVIKNLDKSKFDITVLTIVNIGIYLEEVKQYCKVIYMLPDYNGSNLLEKIKYRINYKRIYHHSAQKVYKKYITEKYDIEIAFVEGFVTKFVAASSNPESKKICWIHIDMEKNPYADSYYLSIQEEQEIYKKFDRIIGVSKSVKEIFERKFSLPNSVDVIYNPVDSKEVCQKANLEIIEREKKLHLISVGRLTKQKGYDRLISVLASLKKYHFQYKLWILGEGSERESLEECIKKYCLEKEIELIGFQKNPYPWIKQADAFICSSRAEGYSLVIAEAMILGKPIFSVDCAGPNELLEFGKYGVLVPNTDDNLRNMLYQLLSGNFDLKQYSQLSMERRSFLELNSIISKIEELFLND